MLTIKHVTAAGELVQPAFQVRLERLAPVSTHNMTGMVVVDYEDGSTGQFEIGVLYVMNRHGATVAKYDMGEDACAPMSHRRAA